MLSYYNVGKVTIMKKSVLVFLSVLLLLVAVPVSAFELTGDIWLLSDDQEQETNETPLSYHGELTLLGLGPVRAIVGADYNGKDTDFIHFFNLLFGKVKPESFSEYENAFHLIGGVNGRIRVDWPLFNGLSVVGSMGHRYAGSTNKSAGLTDYQVTSSLYGGTIYAAGLSLELMRGLVLSSIYEIGPSFSGVHETTGEGTWKSWDVGVQYRIPFFSVKAGYRDQHLQADVDSFSLSGVYFGAGIHF